MMIFKIIFMINVAFKQVKKRFINLNYEFDINMIKNFL
jgi:hypothetical protein